MTAELVEAFEKAESLPLDLQKIIAENWLSDINSELGFDETLERTSYKLENIAKRVGEEHKMGLTIEMNLDEI